MTYWSRKSKEGEQELDSDKSVKTVLREWRAAATQILQSHQDTQSWCKSISCSQPSL